MFYPWYSIDLGLASLSWAALSGLGICFVSVFEWFARVQGSALFRMRIRPPCSVMHGWDRRCLLAAAALLYWDWPPW
ncbi:hypothetical protein P170DRAFT_129002 [Aspergillus steynii IBT 23096]|uniref:Uncharacterized protein n=1 Tax=Aspergillus steynii IBT 23096 TaxID=1392250 RepID=A0A2I2GKH5_9EURO|nr:uncharacterized protein P170DRAFT_129002 [Aspergillus steynii IBT 23096]PLB53380.1 hypothetical protein P170DRAFT_129002 [Aspergillus steynii IBT 23096]